MATLKVNRSDRFPVGTSVGAYPSQGRKHEGKPAGAVTEAATVAADGSLTYTSLLEGRPYQLYALVEGEHRYVRVEGPQSVATPLQSWDGRTAAPRYTLSERVRLRRTLAGATAPSGIASA